MAYIENKQSSESEKKIWQVPTLEVIGKDSIESGSVTISEIDSGGNQS